MLDNGSLRRGAELARDGPVAAGGAEQVLQGADVRSTIADALDRVVGRQGRNLPGNRKQEHERSDWRQQAADGAASERMHPAG